jgi:hypothetical protein
MAEYREIFGEAVQSLPSSTGTIEGQIWYDSSNNALKLIALNAGAWSSGNNMTGTTVRGFQSTGSYTAAVANGGVSSTAMINQTVDWDGTNWSTGNGSPVSALYRCLFGTQTAAVSAGGQNGPSTVYNTINEYDGTNWTTSPGTLVQPTRSARGTGTQTAGFLCGGSDGDPPTLLSQSYTYNGTTVSAVTSMPTVRANHSGSGTSQDSFIAYGGYVPPSETTTATTISWDGSSWSSVNSLNTAATNAAGTFSSSTSALSATTSWPAVAPNEQWDGTCWATIANLSTQRVNACGSGTGANAFVAGGYDNSGPDQNTEATELWTGAAVGTQTITTS